MDKLARTRSSDPEQEKLRAAKDEWNEEVSLLISELIAFKRAVNGRGDKNFGIPPSSIKDPLPPQVSSLMGLISNQSNKVVNEAGKIEQLQNYYSSHRRKSKIASSEIIAEGSWWGSRLWAYFSLLKKVDRAERRLRLEMISSCQELKSDIQDFEKLISAYKVPNSIPAAVSRLNETLYSFLGDLSVNFEKLLALQSAKQEVSKKETQSVELGPQESKPMIAEEAVEDAQGTEYAAFQALKTQQTAVQMVVLHLLNSDEVSDVDKKRLEDNENNFQTKITTYNNLMNRKDIENVVNTDKLLKSIQKHFQILQEIVSKYLGNSDFTALTSTLENKLTLARGATERLNYLNKQAISSIDHWINQKMLSINPSNMDKIRIDVRSIAEKFRKEIDTFSNLLEQGDSVEIVKQFQLIKKSIISLINRVQALANLYETKIRRLNIKEDNTFESIDSKTLRRLEKIKSQLESK